MRSITGPIQNEDCTNFFIAHTIDDTHAATDVIAAWIAGMVRAKIPTLFLNTAAQRTNYRSEVWEPFWEGFDPGAGNDQPFISHVDPEARPRFRAMIENMLALHAQGVDYPDEVATQCRSQGISPWISVRMNDVHCHDNERHPFHATLWREHPELRREGVVGYFAKAFDFGHETVRDHILGLVVETLSRYDVDGIELDFMREPYLFSKGREDAGRPLLTEWVRQVRELCEQAAAQRGHAIGLAVRVPSSPETSVAMGMDVLHWAHDGLIDLLTAAPRWSTAEFDIPIGRWWAALEGVDVALAGGLDVRIEAYPGGPLELATPEHAVGAASQILAAGADLVYLFNYFRSEHPGWPDDQYDRTVAAMGDLKHLVQRPRRHAITYRDTVAPHERYTPPLPAAGPAAELALPTGPPPAPEDDVRLELLLRATPGIGQALEVTVNDGPADLDDETPASGDLVQLLFTVPSGALHHCAANAIRLESPPQMSWQVEKVEIRIAPGERAAGEEPSADSADGDDASP
jgi:hypothetical protein